jgi:hypothetical protein
VREHTELPQVRREEEGDVIYVQFLRSDRLSSIWCFEDQPFLDRFQTVEFVPYFERSNLVSWFEIWVSGESDLRGLGQFGLL